MPQTTEMNPSLVVYLLLISAFCYGAQPDRYLQIYPPYNETDPRTPLTFALLHSFGGSFVSSGAVAGVQVALDVINSNPEILPGYSLHYTLTDSQCNRTVSLDALFKQVLSDPNNQDDPIKIGVLGAGCSVATEATAEISHFYNLAQISCSASSPQLENRVQFNSYFQLLPSQADIAPAYFGVIRKFQWTHVHLIVQNENLFTVTMDQLKRLLGTINFTYTENIFETEEGVDGLGADPFVSDSRIFVFATYANNARALLCKAYTQRLRYPQYLFMTYGWFPDQWWERQPEDENLTCTADNRNSILHHTLALLQYDFPEHLNDTAATDTGIPVLLVLRKYEAVMKLYFMSDFPPQTASEYADREAAHLRNSSLNLERLLASPYCHDATWTLAKALQRTIQDLNSNTTLSRMAWETQAVSTNETFQLENFTYSNVVIRNVIFGHLEQTNFTGVSGPVLFGDSGIRKVNVRRVLQFRASKKNGTTQLERVNIALVTSDGQGSEDYDFKYFPEQNNTITWPSGIPYDGVPDEKEVSVSLALAIVFFILATSGILFAMACIIFNFVYRERILIRISSHNLNYLIAVGAIVLYADVIFSVIPTTSPEVVAALCTLTPWLTAIGYSLCYGTVVVKMWRVYYIFSTTTPQMKRAPKDWMLVLAVGALILIDITILLVYTAVEGYRHNLVAFRVPNAENTEDIVGELAMITHYFIFICDSRARDAFLGVLYGYKGVLQVVTLVLAFSIRKVKIKGLNDAKYILAAIYVSSIVLAVIIVSTYTLKNLVNIFAAVFCTGFFVGTTVNLGLVFGPKMVGLYRDPEGKQVFAKSNPKSTDNQYSSETDNLRRRVRELETMVASCRQQINATSSQEKTASLGSESEPVVRDGDVQDQTTTCSSDPENRENSTKY